MSLFIRVTRKAISHQYKRNSGLKTEEWWNNDWHNMLDIFALYSDEDRIFEAKCQTVANIPDGRYLDTVAVGPFQMKAFVDQRMFYGRIHGICNTFDLEGQRINEASIEPDDVARWLVHDTQKLRPNPPGQQTRVAWSAGCFVMSPSNLEAFGTLLDAYGVKRGDMIDGELVEVA